MGGKRNLVKQYILEEDWEDRGPVDPPSYKEIAENRDISRPTVSKHANELKEDDEIEIEEIAGKKFCAPKGYWNENPDREIVKKHLKDRFLNKLSTTAKSSIKLKRSELVDWKNGEVSESTIKGVAVKVGKSPTETEKLVYEVLEDVIEELEEKFNEERENIKAKNTEEVTVKELSATLESHFWNAIFAFYRCPPGEVEQAFENLEKGKYDDLLKKGVAKERDLKPDSELLEEKFRKARKEVLDDLREDIENEEIPRPFRKPIIGKVDQRENLVGTYLRWSMEEKLRDEDKGILDHWRKNDVDWDELRDETANKVEKQWEEMPDEEIFQERFNSAKEDVLEFIIEKYG